MGREAGKGRWVERYAGRWVGVWASIWGLVVKSVVSGEKGIGIQNNSIHQEMTKTIILNSGARGSFL